MQSDEGTALSESSCAELGALFSAPAGSIESATVRPLGTGLGFLGNISKITIEWRTDVCVETDTRPSEVVCKYVPEGEARDLVLECGLLEREYIAYKGLHSEAQRSGFNLPLVQLYGRVGLEPAGIALGFAAGHIVPLEVGLDQSQALIALEAIAAVHAMTLVCGNGSDIHQSSYDWARPSESVTEFVNSLASGDAGVELRAKIRNALAPNLTAELTETLEIVMQDLILPPSASPLRAVCNNDLWTHNIVFNASDCTLLDWQFCAWGDPLYDVLFLLYSSCNPQDLSSDLQPFLHCYCSALSKNYKKRLEINNEKDRVLCAIDMITDYLPCARHAALVQYLLSFDAFFDMEDGLLVENAKNRKAISCITKLLNLSAI